MRYFVTGSSGFIGQHVVRWLKDKGHEVIAVKRGMLANIQYLNSTGPFEFIHLAAYGNHYDQKDVWETIQANIKGLYNVLQFCQHENCVKLYNISTSSIQLPKQTLYSTSKHFGELMVESCNDPRFVNIRPYSVYGPGEASHRFIPTVIRALRSGETIQLDPGAFHDWIYIDDFVNAVFNGHKEIGTGVGKPNIYIVRKLEEISGKSLKYKIGKLRSYDTKYWVCENEVHHISLHEGLKLTYERTP